MPSGDVTQIVPLAGNDPLQRTCDVLVVVALGVVTGVLSSDLSADAPVWTAIRAFALPALIVAGFLLALERGLAGQVSPALLSGLGRFLILAKYWSLSFAALLFVTYALAAGRDLSANYLVSFYLAGLVVVGGWRVVAPPLFARMADNLGDQVGDWIVVGDSKHPAFNGFVADLSLKGGPRPEVLACDGHCAQERWTGELARLCLRATQFSRSSLRCAIYIVADGFSAGRSDDIVRALTMLPVPTYVLPGAGWACMSPYKTHLVAGRPAVKVRKGTMSITQRAAKRGMDIGLALMGLIVLSPLFAVVSIAIKRDSDGPVLFRQSRSGRFGKPFQIYKFRSMSVMEDGPVIRQASRNDARVTRIGRILRATSVDELPQLLNVLKGEMSLVGPRPHALAHDIEFGKLVPNYEIRQYVKPGITGWAQVQGLRGETTNVEFLRRRIEADVWYAGNASVLLDIQILIRTAFEVLRHRNAY